MSLLSLFILVIAATKHAHGVCDLAAFSSVANPGTAVDQNVCDENCVKDFNCDDNTLTFQATCQTNDIWSETTPVAAKRCIACTWTWTAPAGTGAGAGTTLTASVGAPATLTASVGDVPVNGDTVTWKIGATDLLVLEYDGTTFSTITNTRSLTASFAALDPAPGYSYTLEFPSGLEATDDGADITVVSQGCHGGGTSAAATLDISYCDLAAFSSATNPGTAANADVCGYNCVKNFTCTSDNALSFQATCQANGTWSETTPAEAQRCSCSWTWVAPTGTTMTRSVGAPATFSASVIDNNLADNDILTWKTGNTEFWKGTYDADASPPDFTQTLNTKSVTASFVAITGGHTYTVNIPESILTTTDNNTEITVVDGGCGAGGTSSAVTLSVFYCDLTYFGAEGVAENDAVCGYNCERNFACASGDKNFTATCQEDATWSPTTAQCDDAIRQGGVVALVILSTLVSMTQFF